MRSTDPTSAEARISFEVNNSNDSRNQEKHVTFAICQKCGAEKFGAVTVCQGCGYCPMNGSDRDIALAMLFSDRYMGLESLQALGRDIAKGVDVQVESEGLDIMTQKISKHLDMFRQRAKPNKKWWQFWKIRISRTT